VSVVFNGIANLATSSLMQYIYSLTVDSSPGAVFFISAGAENRFLRRRRKASIS
jgi:hypothetical protein